MSAPYRELFVEVPPEVAWAADVETTPTSSRWTRLLDHADFAATCEYRFGWTDYTVGRSLDHELVVVRFRRDCGHMQRIELFERALSLLAIGDVAEAIACALDIENRQRPCFCVQRWT